MDRATLTQVRKGRGGRLVEVDRDVFDLASRLHEIDPSLGLDWNDTGHYFRVTQTLPNGKKVMVTTARELTPELLDLVRKLVSPDYNLAAEADRMDRAAEKRDEHRFSEQIGEASEKLYHALRKDLQVQSKIYVPDWCGR